MPFNKRNTIFSLLMLSCLSLNAHSASISLAQEAFTNGQYKQALLEINGVLSAQPDSSKALFLKAQIQANNKQADSAITSYRELIRITPNHMEAYNNLAALYAQKGQLKLASETLENAIKTDPLFSTIHSNLRTIYTDLSQQHYRLALKLKPQNRTTQLASVGAQAPLTHPKASKPIVVATNKAAAPRAKVLAPVKVAPKKIAKTEPVPKAVVKAKAKIVAPAKINKPVVKKTITTDSATQIKRNLLAWANAWSNRNAEQYAKAYQKSYATSGKTHAAWLAGRRWNFKSRQFIKVTLSNISIQPKGKTYTARFLQKYQSDSYEDSVNKELVFARQGKSWKIISEQSI